MRYEKFVIMTDMDGTLIGKNQRVSERNKDAIRHFTAQGGSFGAATGRTQKNSAPFMEGLAINAPCIFYNGGALFDWTRQTFLRTRPMAAPGLAAFVQDCLRICPALCVQVFTAERLYVVSAPENHDAVMLAEKQEFVEASLDEVRALPWLKILLRDRRENLLVCEAVAKAQGLGAELDCFFSSPFYLEFVGKDVSKGHMLTEMRKLPTYQGKFFIAVGDFYNDIEMLKRADCGIAPSNAQPEVKATADLIAPVSCDEDLLAYIVEKVIPCLSVA